MSERMNPMAEFFAAVKRALGIAPDLPLQKIVLELDCNCVPRVYIKALPLGLTPEETKARLAGLSAAVVQVLDVTVNPDCSVVATPLPREDELEEVKNRCW
jgi:hypothetical protein